MARRVPRTKAGKRRRLTAVFKRFKRGNLHSGSKRGPKVRSRKQAIAIALRSSGMSRKRGKR